MNATESPVDKREERIRRMFGEIAPWYDFLNHLLSLNIDRRWRRKTVLLAPAPENDPILDLCTGTGDLALEYQRASRGQVEIIGADFCEEMLDRARIKGAKSRLRRPIRFVQADAMSLPFASDHFGLVTCSFGLRNIADTDQGILEMARVLKPGGRLAVLEFSRPTAPILAQGYQWYFRKVLPRIGQWLSKNQHDAYSYLPSSVLQFPDGEALAEKFRQHGLVDVHFHPLTLGIATLYLANKPTA